jgi:5'-nucleotidase
MKKPGIILVTNDDGIHAPGLEVLYQIACAIAPEVWVVAPEVEQSGASHSLTIQTPLRFQQLGDRRYSVRGTPTDCVLMALGAILPKKPDLLLSGINQGGNMAEDISHSGTVAAAMEGTLCGIPSIALSQNYDYGREIAAIAWETAARHAPEVIRRLYAASWEPYGLYNVNFPDCAPDQVAGLRVCPQGRRSMLKRLTRMMDPKGRPHYWLNWADEAYDPALPDSDLRWVQENHVTVTPVRLDRTDWRALDALKALLEAKPA